MRLTPEQQRLAEEGVGISERIARRYARMFPEVEDDLKSSALVGIVKAASSYREDGSDTWYRWAKLHAKYHVRSMLRGIRWRRDKIAFESLDADMEIEDQEGGDDAAIGFDAMISTLPSRHRSVCILIYRDGMNFAQAAREVGLDPSSVSRIHTQAIALLREKMAA